MANEILITPEELRSRAKQVRSLKESHKGTMRRLTNLVQALSAVWKGEAQTAFVQKYIGMKSTFDNFQQTIEDFAVLMDEHADRMEKVDRDMAGRIGKVS